MILVFLVTWATLTQTVTGTHVGPLYLHETFARVQHILGPAPVMKSHCDPSGPENCTPTMTYTDGANTLIIYGPILSPYPRKVEPESQNVKLIELVRGNNVSGTRISRSGVRPLDAWTWESFGVFAPPQKGIPGWKRSRSSNGEVFFEKNVCGFMFGNDFPPGQVLFETHQQIDPRGHWAFNLSYIEFAEGC